MHVTYDLSIDDLPRECIEDCSAPGPVDEAVAYWRERLEFTVDRERAIRCLEGYGAWERAQLEADTPETLAERVLWLACCAFNEWDGTPESSSGSDIFVLE